MTGSTITALVIEDGLFVNWAWVGDSRALLCRNGFGKRLTFDHSLDYNFNPIREAEVERIEKAGGEIHETQNDYRIHGGDLSINMTRAVGDIRMKPYGLEKFASWFCNMTPVASNN